jgi:8-oxo-dGTP pyrophosphatase MutT (NUDIX family)
MLDLDPTREAVRAKDAATLVVVRDAPGGGIDVFCVERQRAGFLGGAVVFPGGKLDAADLDPAWYALASPPSHPKPPWAEDEAMSWGLAIAACREALEEAAILPLVGRPPSHEMLVDWQRRLARKEITLRELIAGAARAVDLAALVPLAHWITPVSESRRYDTRFFLLVADPLVTGAHDGHETTASFWAAPAGVLRRFGAGELELAPPTHRTLEILAGAASTHEAVSQARAACLEPIVPRLVMQGDTCALVLPGDPEHEVAVARSPGASRYVLRAGRFVPGP